MYILIVLEMKFTASKIDGTPVRCRQTYSISSLAALICITLLDSVRESMAELSF
jgi:hypothetical protein